jgi:hypothetical protein
VSIREYILLRIRPNRFSLIRSGLILAVQSLEEASLLFMQTVSFTPATLQSFGLGRIRDFLSDEYSQEAKNATGIQPYTSLGSLRLLL